MNTRIAGSIEYPWRRARELLGLMPAASRVLVVGLGKTGTALVDFLARAGFVVAAVDSRPQPPGLQRLRADWPALEILSGGFDAVQPDAYTHYSVSPGLPLSLPLVSRLAAAGARHFSDIDLFYALADGPTLAVTGANGKSTVTTLAGLMARHAGWRVRVGGNLGAPAADLLLETPQADLNVLELSSFQLERTSCLDAAAATVLNISPDHLDRHADLADYAAQKQRIFRGHGVMVLNADDPVVRAMAAAPRPTLWFSVDLLRHADYRLARWRGELWLYACDKRLLPVAALAIQGRHNWANALAAAALGAAVKLPQPAIVAALQAFRGLDHRMQWVAEISGVRYFNDSKATNVGACQAALAGVSGPTVLIAGGDGKGQDFSCLADMVDGKLRAVVLIGQDADALQRVFAPLIPTFRDANLVQAVHTAQRIAQPGDTVLLAPACSSLDQFSDYAERGRVFTAAVLQLTQTEVGHGG